MKTHFCFLAFMFFIVFATTNGCKTSASGDDNSSPSNTLEIQSLSSFSALPTSLLVIDGKGFSEQDELWVRFSDQSDYKVDIPVLQSSSSQLLVAIPPFINAVNGHFEEGFVDVQLVARRVGAERTSNVIPGFTILNLPELRAKPGVATLLYLEEEIRYLKQVLVEITGTELATSEMLNALSTNLSNLENLYDNIDKIVSNPGGLTSFFNYGSINGIDIKIGLAQLEQSDRLLLALYTTLSDPKLTDPFESVELEKSLMYNPCYGNAGDAVNDFNSGQNNYGVSNYNQCVASALPNAINTAGKVIFGAGSVALGFIALAAISIEVPVAVAVALPTAAILYATIGMGGLEVVTGSVLKNIDNQAAQQAIKNGVGRIEDMLRGIITDQVISDAAGAYKNLLEGGISLGTAFSNSNTASDCSYSLSAFSVDMAKEGGSGTITVTTQDGCTWAATSGSNWITITGGNSGTGNGVVSYTVLANSQNQERIGNIQIADKSFSVSQEANTVQSGPYDGNWTFTMTGILVTTEMSLPYNMTSDMAIQGHDLIGWGDYGIAVLNDNGYAEWTTPENIFNFSGTFYSYGTGIGTWTYGPDGAGTTGSGTWNATRVGK